MKKIFGIVLFTFCIFTRLFAQDDLPKESKIDKNKIKTIVETKYNYESGKEAKQLLKIARYNEKAQLIEYKEYDEKGKFVKYEKYEYNSDGDKSKETQFDAAGKVTKLNEYSYNNRLLKEKISYNPNGKMKSKKVVGYEYY
jgi:hypothetical protein